MESVIVKVKVKLNSYLTFRESKREIAAKIPKQARVNWHENEIPFALIIASSILTKSDVK